MERNWKLNDDLLPQDNALDPITFDDIILAVHCNCRIVNEKTIRQTAKEIIEQRMTDFNFLLANNIEEIREAALVGREGGRE